MRQNIRTTLFGILYHPKITTTECIMFMRKIIVFHGESNVVVFEWPKCWEVNDNKSSGFYKIRYVAHFCLLLIIAYIVTHWNLITHLFNDFKNTDTTDACTILILLQIFFWICFIFHLNFHDTL